MKGLLDNDQSEGQDAVGTGFMANCQGQQEVRWPMTWQLTPLRISAPGGHSRCHVDFLPEGPPIYLIVRLRNLIFHEYSNLDYKLNEVNPCQQFKLQLQISRGWV